MQSFKCKNWRSGCTYSERLKLAGMDGRAEHSGEHLLTCKDGKVKKAGMSKEQIECVSDLRSKGTSSAKATIAFMREANIPQPKVGYIYHTLLKLLEIICLFVCLFNVWVLSLFSAIPDIQLECQSKNQKRAY